MTRIRSGGVCAALLVIGWLCGCSSAERAAAVRVQPASPSGTQARCVATARELAIPYNRYEVGDALGRTITFYVSTNAAGEVPAGTMPLVLFIQGSGCGSLFNLAADLRVHGGIQNMILDLGRDRVRVMVVEKPGVKYLADPMPPGEATACAPEFSAEQTYDRWAAALTAALRAAVQLEGIDRSRVLVMGHSEGSVMAPRVAADNDDLVTHVAALSGGWVTQLYELGQLAWEPERPDEPLEDRARRLEEIYATWEKIRADPNSSTEFAWGHAYRRWSSFFEASAVEQLLRTRAKIYLAQGTADKSTPVEGFDMVRAELSRRGRPFTCERLLGADHGYRRPDDKGWEGMQNLLQNVLTWFLDAGPT